MQDGQLGNCTSDKVAVHQIAKLGTRNQELGTLNLELSLEF